MQSGAGQRKSALVVDGLKRDAASASDGVGVSAKQDVGNGAAGWTFSGADAEYVTFAYDNEVILDDYSLDISAGKILGIHEIYTRRYNYFIWTWIWSCAHNFVIVKVM